MLVVIFTVMTGTLIGSNTESHVIPVSAGFGVFLVVDSAFDLSFSLVAVFSRETTNEYFGVSIATRQHAVFGIGTAGVGGNLLMVAHNQNISQIGSQVHISNIVIDCIAVSSDFGYRDHGCGDTLLVLPFHQRFQNIHEVIVANDKQVAIFQLDGIIQKAVIDEVALVDFIELRINFGERLGAGQDIFPAGGGFSHFDSDIGVNAQSPGDRIVLEGVQFHHHSSEVTEDIRLAQVHQGLGIKCVLLIGLGECVGYCRRIDGA